MTMCSSLESYLNRELDGERDAAFCAHLADCPACAREVERWRALASGLMDAVERAEAPLREVDELAAARVAALWRQERNAEPRKRSGRWRVVAVAAVLMALLGLGIWRFVVAGGSSGTLWQAPSTGPLALALHGDRIGLSASGEVEVLEEGSTTRLRLHRGTIACAVQKRGGGDSFVVEAGDYAVTVVGTRFSVRVNGPSSIEVTVAQGAVRVAAKGKGTLVEAGNMLRGRGDDWRMGAAEESSVAGIAALLGDEPLPAETTSGSSAEESIASLPADLPAASAEPGPTGPAPGRRISGELIAPAAADMDIWRDWIVSGKTAEACAALDRHTAGRPTDLDAWMLLGDCRRKQRDFAASAEAYGNVVSAGTPELAGRAAYRAGTIEQDHLKDPAAAVRMFERCLSTGHPASLAAEATMRMAIALMELGRTDEAKARLQELVRRHEGTESAARARRMLEELR